MHYPNHRPRFPQGNMPRFPAPAMVPHNAGGMVPHNAGGMMRGPWPQRFAPPRPDMIQRFPPGRFPGQPRNMGPNPNIAPMMQKPNHPPMNMNLHSAQHRPNFDRQPGPHGPGPNGPMFRPRHNGPPVRPFAHYQGPPNSFQQNPRFNNSPKQAKGNKKPKIDKRDLPENNRFYCDMCDRGYKDEDKYQAHVDTHEQCPEPGCFYIAAKKLVQLHLKQHASGMAKRVWALESPDDIQKWRDERKRNYPTSDNIAKKNAIRAEKIARGEVIEEKYFGKMRNRGGGNFQRRGRGRGQGGGRGQSHYDGDVNRLKRKGDKDTSGDEDSALSPKKQIKSNSSQSSDTDPLAMFFCNTETDGNSDTESELDQTSSRASPVTAAGALGNLMTLYQDSESEEGEDVDENKDEIGTKEEKKQQIKEGKENTREHNHGNARKPRNRPKKGNKRNNQPPPLVNKSLLEKLLAKEIRQERNKILQCVHFIVKNNFFDKMAT